MIRQGFCAGFLLLAGTSVALAQAGPQLQETNLSARPLTAQEGKAIVDAAWERDQQPGRKPDCSHLTHEVYVLAGYSYPYASSFDLYAGRIANFVRVTEPQLGDLVVWRGHVGIVIDPLERSFYSSVRSGLRTEYYDAPSWKARGTARFYRYASSKAPKLVLAGQRSVIASKASLVTESDPVIPDSSEDSQNFARSMKNVPVPAAATSSAPELSSAHEPVEIPSTILVASAEDKPSRTEIAAAIAELNNAIGAVLREQDLPQLRREVIVYDDLSLDRAVMKGKHGSVEARVESRITLAGERIEPMQRHEAFRLDLVRRNDGWEILAPKNKVYVPRDVAIRMLAARLASLTQAEGVSDLDSRRKQAQVVRVLSALLN